MARVPTLRKRSTASSASGQGSKPATVIVPKARRSKRCSITHIPAAVGVWTVLVQWCLHVSSCGWQQWHQWWWAKAGIGTSSATGDVHASAVVRKGRHRNRQEMCM
eukprot:352249-Chlamydomonas_euryale.AAC.21